MILALLLTGCLYDREQLDLYLTYLSDDDGDGFKEIEEDCDDADAEIHPDAIEICDGLDNNCDGVTDDDAVDIQIWYQDLDSDGFGNKELYRFQCEQPALHASQYGDCDETDPLVHPSVEDEACDAEKDYNCDGQGGDTDQDGYLPCDDCDDADPTTWVGAPEICDDQDNDCDGEIDNNPVDGDAYFQDLDDDGFGDPAVTFPQCGPRKGTSIKGTDCDDSNKNVNPSEQEVCRNGVDDNCNGAMDACRRSGTQKVLAAYEGVSVGGGMRILPDQNSDGVGELLVGAAGSASEHAAIYLIAGGQSGSFQASSSAFFSIADEEIWSGLGGVLDAGQDVTNDGKPDIVAVRNDANGTLQVNIFPIGLGAGNRLDLVEAVIESSSASNIAELAVNHLRLWPDLDNDAHSELSVNDLIDFGNGALYVFDHPLLGTVSTSDADLSFLGESLHDQAGNGATPLDYDGDGLSDWAIAAEGQDSNGENSGAIYLFSSPADGSYTLADADVKLVGEAGDALGGEHLESADLNGDGLDGLIARSGQDAVSGGTSILGLEAPFRSGSVSAVFSIDGGNSNGHPQRPSVHRAFDLDDDGALDLVLTDPNDVASAGRLAIHYGPLAGLRAFYEDADALYMGATAYDQVGSALDIGDLNADTFPDIVVGEIGRNRVSVLDGDVW